MARILLSLLLLGCSFLQLTRAEFGSLGTVQFSQTIRNSVDATTELLDGVDDSNGYDVLTDLSLFSTVLPLMESLGTQVQSLGTAITSAISSSVPNNSGNLNVVFDPIQSAVTALIAFIDGEQTTTRTSLTELLGTDIDHLFGDVFGNLRLALLRVRTAFTDLKTGLQSAPVVSGRSRVSASIVSAVLTAVNLLRSTVPPVHYTITSTIESIEIGDQFLLDLENISNDMISSLQTYRNEFRDSLVDMGSAIADEKDILEADWSTIRSSISPASSNMASLPEYSDFSGSLDTLDSAYNALLAIDSAVMGTFGTYFSTAGTYLDQFIAVLVPRDYLSIMTVLEVLVAGGPNARFCFFKFSPRLVNYYSNLANDVEKCFSVENDRLYSLFDLAEMILVLIEFDLEDLLDNLSECNDNTSPANCIAAIGPLYASLFEQTDYKVRYFQNFAAAEASASIERLGACIYSKRLYNMVRLKTAKADIDACRLDGPDAPDLGE